MFSLLFILLQIEGSRPFMQINPNPPRGDTGAGPSDSVRWRGRRPADLLLHVGCRLCAELPSCRLKCEKPQKKVRMIE